MENVTYTCGSHRYECLDPDAYENVVLSNNSLCPAEPLSWIGDGICDYYQRFVNTQRCGWDGGDCCVDSCEDGNIMTCRKAFGELLELEGNEDLLVWNFCEDPRYATTTTTATTTPLHKLISTLSDDAAQANDIANTSYYAGAVNIEVIGAGVGAGLFVIVVIAVVVVVVLKSRAKKLQQAAVNMQPMHITGQQRAAINMQPMHITAQQRAAVNMQPVQYVQATAYPQAMSYPQAQAYPQQRGFMPQKMQDPVMQPRPQSTANATAMIYPLAVVQAAQAQAQSVPYGVVPVMQLQM